MHGARAAKLSDGERRDILVVEDDPAERAAIIRALEPWAARTCCECTAASATSRIATFDPVVVILDLGLPDADGIDVLRRLRQTSDAGVIVCSGRAAEDEKVRLLEAGADDYVTKPVAERELRARVLAQLRRVELARAGGGPGVVEAGDVRIDLLRKRVTRRGVEVRLTPTEWALLRVLLDEAGRTLPHATLWERVWGRPYGDAQLHLRVHMTHLRRKLEETPAVPTLIVTEPGVGYRLELP
jgi:two-component system KDP operon response regulator KdpE